MTSLQYFDNISFYISPKNKKLNISKIYTKWAVEKCPIWNFQAPWEAEKFKKQKWSLFCWTPCRMQSCCFEAKNPHFHFSLYDTSPQYMGLAFVHGLELVNTKQSLSPGGQPMSAMLSSIGKVMHTIYHPVSEELSSNLI